MRNGQSIHQHFPFYVRPSKISPNWDFWYESKPSGNPDETPLLATEIDKNININFKPEIQIQFSEVSDRYSQGCQIFLGTTYQTGEKYTKLPQTETNFHKLYQHLALQHSPKFTQIWIWVLKNIPSGNPAGFDFEKFSLLLLFAQIFLSSSSPKGRVTRLCDFSPFG
jgi:hypothetical protein